MIRNSDTSFQFEINLNPEGNADIDLDVTKEGIRLNGEDEATLPWADIDKARKIVKRKGGK